MSEVMAMDRRAMLGQLAALIGASALPAGALAAPARRARRFLAAPHFALLGAVADTIIPASDSPGAVDAQVPARIDALLRGWASAQTRTGVSDALSRIDAAARASKGKAFVGLSPAERAEVLRPHDAAALKAVPPPPNAPKTTFFMQATYVADPGYLKIKELVIQLYYFSAVANGKELLYEHVPGKFEPSIKLTPQSRPALGSGPF